MWLWRISNYETLDGTGGLFASGRWHSKGRPVVYTAPNPATALLEVLVHSGEVNADAIPARFKYLKIEVPEEISLTTVTLEHLSEDWRDNIQLTRRLGDEWLAANSTALLQVPSVIVPETLNVLINPRHPGSQHLRIAAVIDYPLDARLR